MIFQEKLNEYIEKIGCSGKELAEQSGLSSTIISRYRSGMRSPKKDSDSVIQIARALYVLSKGTDAIEEKDIFTALQSTLYAPTRGELRIKNLNALLELMEISPGELARAMNYDPSHISRIRTGIRTPADPDSFADGVCKFLLRKFRNKNERLCLMQLIDCDDKIISDSNSCYEALMEWLFNGENEQPDYIGTFLSKLDEFDLNEYIEAIHFNDIKIPTLPFQLPTTKNYYGVEQMKMGELDFFKATALSNSNERVFMCADMPMDDMGSDKEWAKKWMFGLAAMMKKGLYLDMVHNLNRPFSEMMLGLESWIPLYMTGQVTPRYLPGSHNNIYGHMTYVSGAAALSGECISGYHDNGKYYLTKNKEEIAYFRKRSKDILQKAQPLMEIYRAENEGILKAFLEVDCSVQGSRHNILSAPPIYTISNDLLLRILERNNISDEQIEKIVGSAEEQRKQAEQILSDNTLFDEIYKMDEEQFLQHSAKLCIVGAFLEKDITYTFEEYIEHLQLTKEYAKTQTNYLLDLNMSKAFRNIQIVIHEGKWVMISKSNAPAIYFVIKHPKLRAAIENMIIPVSE